MCRCSYAALIVDFTGREKLNQQRHWAWICHYIQIKHVRPLQTVFWKAYYGGKIWQWVASDNDLAPSKLPNQWRVYLRLHAFITGPVWIKDISMELEISLWSTLRWRHNGRDSVSSHQPHHCLLNRLFRRSSNKTSKLCVTGLCVANLPGTGEFPAQMASIAENVSIWWRHHVSHKDILGTVLMWQYTYGKQLREGDVDGIKNISFHINPVNLMAAI